MPRGRLRRFAPVFRYIRVVRAFLVRSVFVPVVLVAMIVSVAAAAFAQAGIEPWAWIVNSSLAVAAPTSPLLRERARAESAEIEAVATRHASRHAVIPMLAEEPVGIERLQQPVPPRPPAAAPVDSPRASIETVDHVRII